jgi:MSHA biogenesis protein MshI
MGLFAKSKKNAGWMSLSFNEDGISAAYVRRAPGSKPVVEYIARYPEGDETRVQSLEKLGKQSRASRYEWTNLLSTGEYQLLSVDAPNVPAEELKTAIRWRLKDMLDFHIDDATIDVLDVPVTKEAAGRAHSMYAIAARNQVISERQALFEQTKIPLSVIDVPEMAQRNMAALLESDGRGLALLSFDSSGGMLTITYAGELYLARRLDVTLDQLAQADESHINALHDRIALELQRSFDHFDRQYRHITLSKLVLSPLGEIGVSLREYLSANLYVPVELMDLGALLDISRVPELKRASDQQRFFLTLGAALREEGRAL